MNEKNKNNSKIKVFVHCVAGVSRSSTIVISYLMKINKWTFDKSLQFVQNKRPKIMPNNGFIQQLKEYQSKLLSVDQVWKCI